jgi:hypothetical protein
MSSCIPPARLRPSRRSLEPESGSSRVPADQEQRNVGLNEAIRLDLDRAGDAPADGPNQRRHARRGKRTVRPLYIVRVLGPALRRHKRDQPIEVSLSERFNRGVGHAASGGSAKAIALPSGSGIFT